MSNGDSEINALAVKRMAETEGWRIMVREGLLMIEDLKDMLVESDEDADKHRGRIEGLRTLLEWPTMVEESASYGKNITIVPEEDE